MRKTLPHHAFEEKYNNAFKLWDSKRQKLNQIWQGVTQHKVIARVGGTEVLGHGPQEMFKQLCPSKEVG